MLRTRTRISSFVRVQLGPREMWYISCLIFMGIVRFRRRVLKPDGLHREQVGLTKGTAKHDDEKSKGLSRHTECASERGCLSGRVLLLPSHSHFLPRCLTSPSSLSLLLILFVLDAGVPYQQRSWRASHHASERARLDEASNELTKKATKCCHVLVRSRSQRKQKAQHHRFTFHI